MARSPIGTDPNSTPWDLGGPGWIYFALLSGIMGAAVAVVVGYALPIPLFILTVIIWNVVVLKKR